MSTALTPMQLALAKRAAAAALAENMDIYFPHTVQGMLAEDARAAALIASNLQDEIDAGDAEPAPTQPAQPAPSKPAVQARPEVLAALAKMRAKQDALEQAPSKPAPAPQQTHASVSLQHAYWHSVPSSHQQPPC